MSNMAIPEPAGCVESHHVKDRQQELRVDSNDVEIQPWLQSPPLYDLSGCCGSCCVQGVARFFSNLSWGLENGGCCVHEGEVGQEGPLQEKLGKLDLYRNCPISQQPH